MTHSRNASKEHYDDIMTLCTEDAIMSPRAVPLQRPKSAGRVRSAHLQITVANGAERDGQNNFHALRSNLVRERTIISPAKMSCDHLADMSPRYRLSSTKQAMSGANEEVPAFFNSERFIDCDDWEQSEDVQLSPSSHLDDRPKSAKGRHREVRRLHSDSTVMINNLKMTTAADGSSSSNSSSSIANNGRSSERHLTLLEMSIDRHHHLPSAAEHDNGALLRVCDRAIASGRKVVDKYRTRSMSDSDEMGGFGSAGNTTAGGMGGSAAATVVTTEPHERTSGNGGVGGTLADKSMNWTKMAYRKPPVKLLPLSLIETKR